MKKVIKWSCPECLSREVRYRPTLGTYVCRRCGHIFQVATPAKAKTAKKT